MFPWPGLKSVKSELVRNKPVEPKSEFLCRSWKLFKVAQCGSYRQSGPSAIRFCSNEINMHGKYEHFVAGFVGGASSVAVSHPLDTIKVRLQTDTRYKSTRDCVIKTFQREGVRGFYKGMAFPLISAALYNGCVFGVYKNILSKICEKRYGDASYHKPTVFDIMLASMGAGGVSVIVGTPIDLIKIKLQVQTENYIKPTKSNRLKPSFLPADQFFTSKTSRSISTSTAKKLPNPVMTGGPTSTLYNGPYQCLKHTIKTEGVGGLYRGYSAMLLRDIPGYAIYFVPYEVLLRTLKPHGRTDMSFWETTFAVVIAGGIAGTLSWGGMHPVDTIKSRLQADKEGKYRGVVHCVRTTVSEEGLGVLKRGLGVNALRGFPQSAALFLAYELTMLSFENMRKKKTESEE